MTTQPSFHPVRLILPVAPQAVAKSRFAAAEKDPAALSPAAALAWLDERQTQEGGIDEVEIAGPGEPLATLGLTLEALDLVRKKYPALKCSVTTLGLHGGQQAEALVARGVKSLIIEIDTLDPEVVQRLYLWIRPAKRTVPLAQAAMILLNEQATCIAACKRAGLAVTIRTTVTPGINDQEVEEIARQGAAWGARAMMILPGRPLIDGEEKIPAPDLELMRRVRALAAKHLPILEAPADLGPGVIPETGPLAAGIPRPSRERPNLAVVSSSGMEVDLHLGQATRILLFGPREDGLVSLLETREAPAAGAGTSRWECLAEMLPDCFALLAASAGENPRAILHGKGITVLITSGEIAGTVDHLYGGGKQGKCRK